MKLSMADFLPKHRRTAGLETVVWAAKILFLLIGIASTAILMARFAFPYLLILLSFSLPKLWNWAFSWLAPPYLFITVHFIIMVIWKLHRNQRPEDVDDPFPVPQLSTKSSQDLDTKSTEPVTLDPPEISIESHQPDSCEIHTVTSSDTTVGEENSTEQRMPEFEPEEMKEDSIDATWQAIMESKSSPVKNKLKKSDTWEKTSHAEASRPTPTTLKRAAAVDSREFGKSDTFRERTERDEGVMKEMRKSKTFREPTTVGWRGRDVLVVGHDELFRKAEAFIKMNYDQMRPQRQESEQRYVEMVNAAY